METELEAAGLGERFHSPAKGSDPPLVVFSFPACPDAAKEEVELLGMPFKGVPQPDPEPEPEPDRLKGVGVRFPLLSRFSPDRLA